MDETTLAAYLDRIGVSRPRVLDEAALGDLYRAHLMAVPFENLSIHLAEPISLAEDGLIDKIVTWRRGGFCYELNGAFALLLQALGARVVRAAARVYGDGRLGPPFDHLTLIVRLAGGGGPWLADVGFGSHSTYPLRYDSRDGQHDPAGPFSLADAGDGDVEVLRNGEPQYRIEPRERSLADFIPHLLVAADRTGIPFHPGHDLLAAHRRRQGLDQRPHPDPDQPRVMHRRGTADRRCRPCRLPRSFRHRPGPGPHRDNPSGRQTIDRLRRSRR